MEAKGSRNNSRQNSGRLSVLSKADDVEDEDYVTDRADAKARSGIADRDGKFTLSDSKANLALYAAEKYASSSLDFAEEKQRILEIQQELEAEEEFERLRNAPSVIKPCVARTAFARDFVRGFNIISMNMRDAMSGRLMWRSSDWDIDEMFTQEIKEEVPKGILNCRVVSREIIFSSLLELEKFRLEQRVYYRGVCIEEWFFKFGYVMSGSRNSWQQTIDAAPPDQMLSAETLSGNVIFETAFYDDQTFLCKNSVRIFYV